MTEKEIGKIAAGMMQKSLRNVILNRGLLRNSWSNKQKGRNGDSLPLSKSKGLARMQKNSSSELRGIAIKMGRHGFILNNGVNIERRSGTVHRQKPNSIFYKRKAHPFYIRSYDFIDEAVEKSGAVPYLKENIGQLKIDQVINVIKFGLENGK